MFLLATILLVGAITSCQVALGGTLSETQGFCNAPEIPTDLSLEKAVEASGDREIHLHGLYRIGLDEYSALRGSKVHTIALRADEGGDHAFRLAIAPHDADSVDLYLFSGQCSLVSGDTRPIVSASSVTSEDDAEQHIFAVLKEKTDYCVEIAYTTTTSAGTPSDSSGDCSTVLMELAFQPYSKMKKFVDACEYSDGSIPELPNPIKPHDENDNNYFFEHDSSEDKKTFWAQYSTNKVGEKTHVVAKYPIDLPRVHGRSQRWKLWMSLQSRFMDSGDLTAILTVGDDTRNVPTPELCSPQPTIVGNNNDRTTPPPRSNQMICWFGTRAIKNHVLIQSELWAPSKYTLWILLNKRGSGSGTCIPYAFDLKVFPLPEKESFVTCDNDPMPRSFNVPGMYNEATGTMAFSQDILVNLTADRECASIRATKPNSLIRAFVGAHPSLDLDISLEEADKMSTKAAPQKYTTVATSSRISGPDAILYVLKQNIEYKVCVTISHAIRDYIPGQDHDFYDFCDSYDLRVDVYPLTVSTGTSNTCEGKRANKPSFVGLQEKLDKEGEMRFGVADYSSFPFTALIDLKAAPAQQELFQFDFTVSVRSSFRAIAMPVDPIGAPVILVLSRERKAFEDSEATFYIPVAYGEPLTIGQKLGWSLEQGSYRLQMLTPPIQLINSESWSSWLKEITSDSGSTAISAAALPSCLQYNFELVITKNQQCLEALPLPSTLSVTSISHRHIDELFLIDGSSHTMILSADPKAHQTKLHILVSRSDSPVTISIFDNKENSKTPLMVSQSTPSGVAEVFATLPSVIEHRIQFDFRQGNTDSLCKSMNMQVSSVARREEESLAEQCEASSAMTYSADIITLSSSSDYELGSLAIPSSEFTGKVFKMSATTQERKANTFTRKLHFSLAKAATFRLTAEYGFPTHIVSARVCRCTPTRQSSNNPRSSSTTSVCTINQDRDGTSDCMSATGYFNGAQVAAIPLAKGDYAVELRWSDRIGKASNQRTQDEVNYDDDAGDSESGDDGWTDEDDAAAKSAYSHRDESYCALVYVQYSVSAFVDPVSALNAATPTTASATAAENMMCDPELQYLPKTLNSVSYLWAGYNEEVHLYQNLLVPVQHESDTTKVKITKTSYVRMSLPSDIVRAVAIISNDEAVFSTVDNGYAVSGGTSAFAKLEPGSYTIAVGYYAMTKSSASMTQGAAKTRMCTYMPFELSIVPVASFEAALATTASSCKSSALISLPKTPYYSGKDIRYRDLIGKVSSSSKSTPPTESFSTVIPFTIDARGGAVQFDIRYDFPIGALSVKLEGVLTNVGGGSTYSTTAKRLPWSRRSNRALIDRVLPAGRYNLTLYDSTLPSAYTDAGLKPPACVPFSLHLREVSYVVEGNTGAPVPTGKGGATLAPIATADPEHSNALSCPYTTYDQLPTRIEFKDTDEQTLELSGNGFPIPFSATASTASGSSSSSGRQSKKVSVDISIPARSGYTFRAVATTKASVSLSMELFYDQKDTGYGDEEATEVDAPYSPAPYQWMEGTRASQQATSEVLPVVSSRLYGTTSSLTYTCAQGQCDSAGRYRLRLTFAFDKAPRYHEEYENCMRKFLLDSYRLYLSVQATSVLLQGSKCTETQLAILAGVPPPTAAPVNGKPPKATHVSPRLPPKEIEIGSSALVLSLADAFLSDSDRVVRSDYWERFGGNSNGGGGWNSGSSSSSGNNVYVPIGQSPSSFKLRTHITFNTTLIIPEGVKNVTSYLQLRYNLNWMNFKVEIFKLIPPSRRGGQYLVEGEPLYEASGNPSQTIDRSANGELHMLTSPLLSSDHSYLQAGRYLIRFSANIPFLGGAGGSSRGGGRHQQLEFCLPFNLYFMVTAQKYLPRNNDKGTLPPGVTQLTNPPTALKTENKVVDFSPRQIGNLDPSEPVVIQVTLSTEATLRPSSRNSGSFAYLQEDDDLDRDKSKAPHRVPATNIQFLSGRDIKLTFYGLRWLTTYRLRLDGSLLIPVDRSTDPHNLGYDTESVSMTYASAYTTTWCSCDREGYCVGGGGCGCTEVNGETCNTCQSGWDLSKTAWLLENGVRSRVCLQDGSAIPPVATIAEGGNQGGPNHKPPVTTKGGSTNHGDGGEGPKHGGGSGGTSDVGHPQYSTTASPSNAGTPSPVLKGLRTFATACAVGFILVASGYYAVGVIRAKAQRPVYSPLGSRPDAVVSHNGADEDEDSDDEYDIIRPEPVTASAALTRSQLPNSTTSVPIPLATATIVSGTPIVKGNVVSTGNALHRTAMNSTSSTGSGPAIPMTEIVSGTTVSPSASLSTTAAPRAASQQATASSATVVPQTTRAASVPQPKHNGSGSKIRDPFDDDDDEFFGN